MSQHLGVRPSAFLGINDPTLAFLWDISLLAPLSDKSVKGKIMRHRAARGFSGVV